MSIPEQHAEMVSTLAKPGSDIVASMTASKSDLWHHVTGVVTEAGELLDWNGEDNLIEELGDMEFYLAGVRANLGLSRYIVDEHVDGRIADLARLAFWCTELLDATKKVVIYEQDPDLERFRKILCAIECRLYDVRQQHGLAWEATLEANMSKLAKRFPDFKYTNARAKERADKQ